MKLILGISFYLIVLLDVYLLVRLMDDFAAACYGVEPTEPLMGFASIAASEARVGSLISRGDGANVPPILLAAWAGRIGPIVWNEQHVGSKAGIVPCQFSSDGGFGSALTRVELASAYICLTDSCLVEITSCNTCQCRTRSR